MFCSNVARSATILILCGLLCAACGTDDPCKAYLNFLEACNDRYGEGEKPTDAEKEEVLKSCNKEVAGCSEKQQKFLAEVYSCLADKTYCGDDYYVNECWGDSGPETIDCTND